VEALKVLLKGILGGYASLLDILWSPVKNGIAWVMRLFGWDEAAAATETFSIKTFILGVFKTVKIWFTKLFSWGDPEKPFKLSEFISGLFEKLWGWVSEIFPTWETFQTKLAPFINFFNPITDLFKKFGDWVSSIFSWDTVKNAIMSFIPSFWFPGKGTLEKALGKMGGGKTEGAPIVEKPKLSKEEIEKKKSKEKAETIKKELELEEQKLARSKSGKKEYEGYLWGTEEKGQKKAQAKIEALQAELSNLEPNGGEALQAELSNLGPNGGAENKAVAKMAEDATKPGSLFTHDSGTHERLNRLLEHFRIDVSDLKAANGQVNAPTQNNQVSAPTNITTTNTTTQNVQLMPPLNTNSLRFV
jgi:hypothetical protein